MESNNSIKAIEPGPEVRAAVDKLWQMLRAIEPSLGRMAVENNRLFGENAELTSKLELNEKKLTESYGAVEALKGQAEEDDSKIKLLINQCNELKQENSRIADLEDIIASIKVQQTEAEEIKANFAIAQKEFASKNQTLQERAETIKSLQSRIAALEDNSKEIELLRNNIRQYESIYIEQKTKTDALESEKEGLQLRITQLEGTVVEIELLQNNIRQYESIENELKIKTDALEAQKEALQQNYLETEQLFEEEISDLHKEVDAYKEQIKERDEQLQTLIYDLESLRGNKAEIEQQKLSSDEEADEMRNKLKLKSEEINSLNALNNGLKEQIGKLQDEFQANLDSLESNGKDESENYRVELSKRNAEIVNLQAERDDYIMKSLEQEGQINQLNSALENKNSEIEKLSEILSAENKIKEEMRIIEEEYSIVSEKLTELNSQKSNLEKAVEETKSGITAKDEQISRLNQKITELEDQLISKVSPTILALDPQQKKDLIEQIENYIGKIDEMLLN